MKENKSKFLSRNLGLDKKRIKKGFNREIIKEEDFHFRFDKRYAGVGKGTCVFKNNEVVTGYPKIRRALILSPTIQKRFGEEVAVEEKLNGCNVRVIRINEKILCLTRSGLICPYLTSKAREKINTEFFKKNPDKVIFGEMVGPDNPYTPTKIYDVDSLDLLTFDIRKKGNGERLSIKDRRKLCDEFNLKKVNLFGFYKTKNCVEKIHKIIKRLGKRKREGVVIKDPLTNLEPIKYTAPQSNSNDLNHAYRFFHDYGDDFIYSRTVREGFQSFEWNESKEELEKRAKRIGINILEPMRKTIKEKKEGEKITETVHIKVKNLGTAKKFINHLNSQGINTEVKEIKKLNQDNYKVFIDKFQESTNDKTEHLLNGGLW